MYIYLFYIYINTYMYKYKHTHTNHMQNVGSSLGLSFEDLCIQRFHHYCLKLWFVEWTHPQHSRSDNEPVKVNEKQWLVPDWLWITLRAAEIIKCFASQCICTKYKVQFITDTLTFCRDSDKVTWRDFCHQPYYNTNKQAYHLENSRGPLHSLYW